MSDRVRIVKAYKVFHLDLPLNEPLDTPTEQQLHGWLRTRGYSDQEAIALIKQVDEAGEAEVTLP
jgi:hypothetical protein